MDKAKVIDIWHEGTARYVIYETKSDNMLFYDAVVKESAENYATYHYEFGTDKPSRQHVMDKHISDLAMEEIDRYEAMYGADGKLAQERGKGAW